MTTRLCALFLVMVTAATSCVVTRARSLWRKNPGLQSKLFAFERNRRVGFITASGKIAIPPKFVLPIEDVGDFVNGLARIGDEGYVDEQGQWIIRLPALTTQDFSDAFAKVFVERPGTPREFINAVIDRQGRFIEGFNNLRLGDFSEGMVSFEAPGKPSVRSLKPNHFVYIDYPGLQGFLDYSANIVVKASFAAVGRFQQGLAWAALDGYCHLISAANYVEGTPTTGYPTDCGGAPADAVATCKVGFINQKGEFAIEPRFESAQDFAEDLAPVRIDGYWGFINKSGALVISARYDQVQSFSEGRAAVLRGGKWGFIDHSGVETVRRRYLSVEPFSDHLSLVESEKGYSFIGPGGEVVLGGPYREATPFVNGLAAILGQGNRVAYIDRTGREIFQYTRSDASARFRR